MIFRTLPVLAVASWAVVAGAAESPGATTQMLEEYCLGCHNADLRVGNLNLEEVDVGSPDRHAAVMEKVLLKLRAGMMPPQGMPRPTPEEMSSFVEGVESAIDQAAAASPNPGRPVLHRLNRTEYARSIRDLLGLDVDVTSLLPPDDMSEGYDNLSDVLTVSPTLLEGYIRAAGKISRLAVGDPEASAVVETYVVPVALSQMRRVEGAPFGTRGGLVVRHNFPADGDYVFRLNLYHRSLGALFGDNKPAEGEQIEIAVNGARVALFDIDRKRKTTDEIRSRPIHVKAGPQTISASFLTRAEGPVQDFVMPFEQSTADLTTGNVQGLTGLPHLKNLAIDGPYDVSGVSETPSRRRIFVCRPEDGPPGTDESACAETILARLARRAFRRPLTETDRARLMRFFSEGREERGFDSGIQTALQAILADPEFLFRFERVPHDVAPGDNFRVSDLELASRLSFFLWSSIPDDELLDLASAGRLADPEILESQVLRMLADPRAEALSTNFAAHWLRLQNLKDVHPDVYLYPDWEHGLTESMRRETEMFFDAIVREDRSILELLDADFTFVDERLARHYGMPVVVGTRFRRVPVEDENRRGLLGHGSVLTLTSLANRTSPVLRGAWILDVLLGTPAPRPPADVPPLEEIETGERPRSVRERLEEHRRNPACASCHAMMDPLGFSLENFDAVGAWRLKDGGLDVDASGRLFDGTEISGPVDLRAFLLRSRELFVENFTRNLLMYALGRVLRPYDMPAVRSIATEAAESDHRFSALVLGIVRSTPFQMRRAERYDVTTTTDSVQE